MTFRSIMQSRWVPAYPILVPRRSFPYKNLPGLLDGSNGLSHKPHEPYRTVRIWEP